MPSLQIFRQKIQALRRDQEHNPTIGCTILTQPFYLEEGMYIDPPVYWSSNIVTGKSYRIEAGSEGLRLFEEAQNFFSLLHPQDLESQASTGPRFGKELTTTPSARKVDASPSRPFSPPGGLMEPFNASLQRDRKS
jgi:hypothetical protein